MAAGAVILLAVLVAIALWNSGLPRWAAISGGVVAMWRGWSIARREYRRGACRVSWLPAGDEVRVEYAGHAERWQKVRWHLRAPLAQLTARDASGRLQHLFWWPDTLPSSARRRLRIALERPSAAAVRVAPKLAS